MTGSDIAERDKAGELAPLSDQEQSLVDAAKSKIDRARLTLPAVKLTHSLTTEVQQGKAEAGHWVNSLTGEDYGETVEIVIAALFDGRFYSENGKNYAAQGDVAPDNWPDLYAGKHFADITDAEEQWKADSNAEIHPWGKGPPISTTHNFVGYVVGDDSGLPVRISLMRSGNKAARKLHTLIFAARAPWDHTYTLGVDRESNDNNQTFYVPTVSSGNPTETGLRQRAVELAQEIAEAESRGELALSGDEDQGGKVRKPSATSKGKGLGVS